MSYFIDILPTTAVIPIIADNPHLDALVKEIRSIVMLIGLSKPVNNLFQKEYISTWSCQQMVKQTREKIIGVN